MTRYFTTTAALAAFLTTGAVASAESLTCSYEYLLEASPTPTNPADAYNAPLMTFRNTGNVAITRFGMTIGDTDFNFDAIVNVTADGIETASIVAPDDINNGVRTDRFELAAEGFDGGEQWSADVDVDEDDPTGVGTIVDVRNILFNNGEADDAEVFVEFANGKVLSVALDNLSDNAAGDFDDADVSYDGSTLRVSQAATQEIPGPPTVIPTPAAAGAGLALLGLVGLRRRQA